MEELLERLKPMALAPSTAAAKGQKEAKIAFLPRQRAVELVFRAKVSLVPSKKLRQELKHEKKTIERRIKGKDIVRIVKATGIKAREPAYPGLLMHRGYAPPKGASRRALKKSYMNYVLAHSMQMMALTKAGEDVAALLREFASRHGLKLVEPSLYVSTPAPEDPRKGEVAFNFGGLNREGKFGNLTPARLRRLWKGRAQANMGSTLMWIKIHPEDYERIVRGTRN